MKRLAIIFALLSLPVLAQVTYVQSTECITVAASPATCTLSGVVSGHHIGGQFMETGTTNTLTVTDSCGDTVTTKTDTFATRRVVIFDITAGCSGTVQVSGAQSGTPTSSSMVITEVKNTSGTDGTLWNTTNSLTGGNITTTAADYIAAFGSDGGVLGGTVTAGAGFVLRSGGTTAICPSFACGYEDLTQSVSGSVTPSFSYTQSGSNFITSTIPYKPYATSYVNLSTSALDFGSEIIGTTTAGQVVTLTNVGSATLNITSIVATSPFTKSASTCGATLATTASCTATVTFTPASSGIFSGTLTFTTDAPTSPDVVTLAGIGSILDPSRSINWSKAGTGTIPARATLCSSLTSTATLTQINNAIAACTPGQTVKLAAGTYGPYSGEILWNNVSGVTLRGAGANNTFLTFSTCGNGNGLGACLYAQNSDPDYSGGPSNVCNWTAGYTQGTNSITLGSCPTGALANLKVGSLLILDQLDDSTDTGGLIVCQTSGTNLCTTEGSSGVNGGRPSRAENQPVIVTSISGSTIGITPGLYAPNWRSGQTPQVWFSNALPVTGVGIENLSIDTSSVTAQPGGVIMFDNTAYSWVLNVRSINANAVSTARHKHVWLYQSSHITVQNSYFYGSAGSSESYGVDSSFSSSDNLIVNNICQKVSTCTITEGDAGSVFAYNYAINNLWTSDSTFQQLDCSHHGAFEQFTLWEGNQGTGCSFDDTHGYSFGLTMFRNYYHGRGSGRTAQTIPLQVWLGSRYSNIIGNVLGTSGYHTTYTANPAATTTCGSLSTGNTSVFSLGWSQTEGVRFATIGTCPSGLGAAFNMLNDTSVVNNIMRWGNYDVVNAGTRFVNGEVPSGISPYGNAIPGNHTLPSSFIFSAKPAFFGSVPWPATGPDVTSGNISGVGGFANNIPAKVCYTNQGGSSDGTGGAIVFDASLCYAMANATAPTFSPVAGTYAGTQSVTLASAGNTICYNTTGAPATNGSTGCTTGTLYTTPVSVSVSETLYAVAGGVGLADSSVASAVYVITAAVPAFSPAPATYATAQSVTISCATGPVACYNITGAPATNGTSGCTTGTLYSTPVSVPNTETLYAVCGGTGFPDGPVASGRYNINAGLAPGFLNITGTLKVSGSFSTGLVLGGSLTYAAMTTQCELGTEANCPSGQPLTFLYCNTGAYPPGGTYTPVNTTPNCPIVNGGTPPNIGGLTGVNTIITEPDFNSKVSRATDYNTQSLSPGCAGSVFDNHSAGNTNFWSSDSTKFIIENLGAQNCLVSFSADSTMTSLPSSISGNGATCSTNCTQFIGGSGLVFYSNDPNSLVEVTNDLLINKLTISACSPSIGTCTNHVAPTQANSANWVFSRTKIFDFLNDCGGHCGLPSAFVPTWTGTINISDDDSTIGFMTSDNGQSVPTWSDGTHFCPQPAGTTVTKYGPSFIVNYKIGTGWRVYNMCGLVGVNGGTPYITGSYGSSGVPTDGTCSSGCAPDGMQPVGTSGGAAIPDYMFGHDGSQAADPHYMTLTPNASQSAKPGSCSGKICINDTYFWEAGTTNVRYSTCVSHSIKGYLYTYCGHFYTAYSPHNPLSAPLPNGNNLLAVGLPWDDHGSGNNMGLNDYQPGFGGTVLVCDQNGTPGGSPTGTGVGGVCPTYANVNPWNEVIGIENTIGNYTNAANLFGKHCDYGSGPNTAACVYRFGNTYNTATSPYFSPQNNITNVDPTGRYALFTSDWFLTLGCTNGQSTGCLDPVSAGNVATTPTISNVAVDGAGTVATITVANTSPVFSTGMYPKFSNLGNATFLNGNNYLVTSFSTTQFTVCATSIGGAGVCNVGGIGHASYSGAETVGTAHWATCTSGYNFAACPRADMFVMDLRSAHP